MKTKATRPGTPGLPQRRQSPDRPEEAGVDLSLSCSPTQFEDLPYHFGALHTEASRGRNRTIYPNSIEPSANQCMRPQP